MTQSYIIENGDLWLFEGITPEERQDAVDDFIDPSTPDEVTLEYAFVMKTDMIEALKLISVNKGTLGDATDVTLERIKTDILALKELSGEAEDVRNALDLLIQELRELIAFKFPFEPADPQP